MARARRAVVKGETTTMRKTKTPTPKEKPEPTTPAETIAAPDWVNETPDDNSYSLNMYAWDGDNPQSVSMSRREFIMTKRLLAALRGLPLGAPREHWDYSHVPAQDHLTPEKVRQLTLEITQEELEMVMDFERVGDELCLNIRRRLKEGASIEAGKWQVSEEGDGVESYEGETTGTCRCGLQIIEQGTKTGTAGA
jgi:hypothetical protein